LNRALKFCLLEDAFNAAVARGRARTKTAKTAERIEFEAQTKLKGLISKLSDESLGTGKQLQDLKSEHGNEVSKTIRKVVHDSYMTGAEYTGRAVGEDVIYPSTANVQKIGELSDDVETYFWRQLDLQIKAGETQKFAEQSMTPDQLETFESANPLMGWYNDLTAGLLVANLAVYPSLADGTVDKFGELAASNPSLVAQGWVIRWRTMEDPNVCMICQSYDGLEYDFNDPDIPHPRYDTHPNCRCILEVVTSDDEDLTGATIPIGPEGFLFDEGFIG